jgi:hypothetical protein
LQEVWLLNERDAGGGIVCWCLGSVSVHSDITRVGERFEVKLAVIIKGILETEASYLLLPSRFWISEQAVPVVDASRCEEGRWASMRDHLRRDCLCHCCIAVPNMRNVVPRVEEPSTSLIDQELPLPFNNEQRLGIFVRDGFCPRCDAAQCAHALVSESL